MPTSFRPGGCFDHWAFRPGSGSRPSDTTASSQKQNPAPPPGYSPDLGESFIPTTAPPFPDPTRLRLPQGPLRRESDLTQHGADRRLGNVDAPSFVDQVADDPPCP